MANKKWKMPKWMESYREILNYNGWTPEKFMNCDGTDCNIVVNAPKAIMCTVATTRVQFLATLHEQGKLAKVDPL